MNAGYSRALAWAAIAGQVVFTVCWVVAGALEPGYSYLDQPVSELGAKDAAHPLIGNAGIVVLGLSLAALGVALLGALPRRRARTVAVVLFVGAGAAIVVEGFARLDCGLSNHTCETMFHARQLSWTTDAHLWAGLVDQTLIVLTPFALARALWPGPTAAGAISSGVFGIGFGALSWLLYGADGVPDGLVQRIGLLILHLWVVIVAVGVLYETRPALPPGRLVGIRPKDFFAREWRGEGELVVWPFFLWRRLGQRFEAHRTCTWISDAVWRMDDEARYGHGRVQQRRMFCEFVAADQVHVTGDNMPSGADVVIQEDGYRVTPFPVAFPIGPVNVPLICHDVSHVEPDGTFANTYEARSIVLGLLFARVTFRVKPVGAAEETPASTRVGAPL
jgi:hypothetical protein